MLENAPVNSWTFISKFFFRFCFTFVLLFIFSFSFDNARFDPGRYLNPFFENLAAWTGKTFFNYGRNVNYKLESDSTGFYLNALNLLFISGFISIVWGIIDKKRSDYQLLAYWFFVFIRYYLAMQLLTYGFNKIFKWQFYLPEPNTLFTTIGSTPRDFLYWTSMGTSRAYVVFSGIIEIIPALLLLFRRTYIAGAVVALMVMINVLMINIGFNISVKLYSGFLLLLCIILLIPECKKLFKFFFAGQPVALKKWQPVYSTKTKSRIYLIVKGLVVLLIISKSFFIYLQTRNFNDDSAERPFLHGAYDVTLFVKNGDTLLPLTTDEVRWKRVFIHRRGYCIMQNMNDEMTSYMSFVNIPEKQLMFRNEDGNGFSSLNYSEKNDSTLLINGTFFGDKLNLELRKIDLEKLPLMQDDFQWAWDE
ncbi:MAG: hypothetical protein M3R17_19560 [Bacteroidota bacterium]|nr:hypothetical protein [Bacteroidota bacterium]